MTSGNWFLGLPVDGASWLHRVAAAPPEVKLFHPDDLHLTIAFLGPCGEARARAAWDSFRWELGAVDASFGGVIPMGSPRHWSALSATLEESREVVEDAMGASRGAACEAAGVPVDGRPPKAHCTIARLSRRAIPEQRAEAVRWAAALDLRGVGVRLDRVALYAWSEDRAEHLFRIVESRRS